MYFQGMSQRELGMSIFQVTAVGENSIKTTQQINFNQRITS